MSCCTAANIKFKVVNKVGEHYYTQLIQPDATILFNVNVDDYEQYGQHNIAQSCYTAGS